MEDILSLTYEELDYAFMGYLKKILKTIKCLLGLWQFVLKV